jgi:hypothetical protein
MVMGNILLFKHLGRDWRWPVRDKEHPEHTTYMKILRMFLDKKDSEYSLHMIGESTAVRDTHHYVFITLSPHPQLTRGQILVVQSGNGSDPIMWPRLSSKGTFI